MSSIEKQSPLTETFSEIEKEEVGHVRRVWKIVLPETESGSTYYIKDKKSEAELEIQKLLAKTDISEKLLGYDSQKLAFAEVKGQNIVDYVNELIKRKPHTEHIYKPDEAHEGLRFKVLQTTKQVLAPEVLLTDLEVSEFSADYVSKVIVLLLLGIFHNDIKVDNVLVSGYGVRFLDFSEGQFLTKEMDKNTVLRAVNENLARSFELIQNINVIFKDIVRNLERDFEAGTEDSVHLFMKPYFDIRSRNIPLSERAGFIERYLAQDNPLHTQLLEWNFPEAFARAVENKVILQLKNLKK